jgi:hypothetical protein
MTDHPTVDLFAHLQRSIDRARADQRAQAACSCDPHHLDAGGYDPGCVVHDTQSTTNQKETPA